MKKEEPQSIKEYNERVDYLSTLASLLGAIFVGGLSAAILLLIFDNFYLAIDTALLVVLGGYLGGALLGALLGSVIRDIPGYLENFLLGACGGGVWGVILGSIGGGVWGFMVGPDDTVLALGKASIWVLVGSVAGALSGTLLGAMIGSKSKWFTKSVKKHIKSYNKDMKHHV